MKGRIDGDHVVDERGSKWRIVQTNQSGECAIEITAMVPTAWTKQGGGGSLKLGTKCAIFSNGTITEVGEGEEFDNLQVRRSWLKP